MQHAQEQLPLLIVGHSIELAPVHAVVVVQVDQLGDVNALLRFPAADWSGHLVCRLCIIPLADCASKTCQKLVEIGRVGSSVGQYRRPVGSGLRRSGNGRARADPPPERVHCLTHASNACETWTQL